MKRITLTILIGLCLIVGGFLLGSLSHYDQLEVGKAIVVHDGQVFTPESWDDATANSNYAVVGIYGKWKWPWAKETTRFIDGITLLGDPKLGSLKFYGTLKFGDGTFTIPSTVHLQGADIIGNGTDRTLLKLK